MYTAIKYGICVVMFDIQTNFHYKTFIHWDVPKLFQKNHFFYENSCSTCNVFSSFFGGSNVTWYQPREKRNRKNTCHKKSAIHIYYIYQKQPNNIMCTNATNMRNIGIFLHNKIIAAGNAPFMCDFLLFFDAVHCICICGLV